MQSVRQLQKLVQSQIKEMTKVQAKQKKVMAELEKLSRALNGNIATLNKDMLWLKSLDNLPVKDAVKGLKKLDKSMSKMPQPLLKTFMMKAGRTLCDFRKDNRVSRLIAQVIREYEKAEQISQFRARGEQSKNREQKYTMSKIREYQRKMVELKLAQEAKRQGKK